MHTVTNLKKSRIVGRIVFPLIHMCNKIRGEWENNLNETYTEGLADTLCVWPLLCLLLQWRVCVCVDKLDLGFSMAFVRHGFMNYIL
jgi:hypothetical protein